MTAWSCILGVTGCGLFSPWVLSQWYRVGLARTERRHWALCRAARCCAVCGQHRSKFDKLGVDFAHHTKRALLGSSSPLLLPLLYADIQNCVCFVVRVCCLVSLLRPWARLSLGQRGAPS